MRGEANRWRVRTTGPWKNEVGHATFTLPELKASKQTRAIYPELEIPVDLFAEFLGYFVSEGFAYSDNNLIGISQRKPEGVEKIRTCLQKMPIRFGKYTDNDGCVRWQGYDKALNLWLREHCGYSASVKKLPSVVFEWERQTLIILWNAMMLGDGWIDPRDGRTGKVYYTSSLELADQVQVLSLMTGNTSKVSLGERCYRVSVLPKTEALIGQDAIKRMEAYRGRVYCYNVANHLFVTRRKSKIAITHNTAAEMGVPTTKKLRARQRLFVEQWRFVLDFVIDKALLAGTLTEDVDRRFTISAPQVWAIDTQRITSALVTGAQGLMMAEQSGWISKEEAAKTFRFVADQLGVSLSPIKFKSGSEKIVPDGEAGDNPDSFLKSHAEILMRNGEKYAAAVAGRKTGPST